eukprot:4330120-Prymnesium_polylepis.1
MAQPHPGFADSRERLRRTTCAITRCAGVVARRAQRRTRHALRYDVLPFERTRSRLRPPILC